MNVINNFKKYLQINEAGDYNFSIYFFKRILAITYLIAFLSFGLQAKGLIGKNGILPAAKYFQALTANLNSIELFLYKPSIFLLFPSDIALKLIPILGVILSLLLFFKFKERLTSILLYICYLSLVIAGQEFMAFQWDNLLLEAGFLSIFLTYDSSLMIWLFRWLLFRLMFTSGLVKLASGDELWWSLEALQHHYLTQPLPTVLAWYMDKFPLWFHKISAAIMFFIELIVPFFYFAENRLRLFAALSTVGLMAIITATGNYTLFTFLTAVLVVFLIKNKEWNKFINYNWVKNKVQFNKNSSQYFQKYILPSAGIFLVFASTIVFVSSFGTSLPSFLKTSSSVIRSYRIANSYGLFANMTHPRYEIIIQGSHDGNNWKTFEFKYKPGDLSEPPQWVQPHQPRLDWQMWFAALSNVRQQRWFQNFIIKLLEDSKPVSKLLEHNPFPATPPTYIRAIRYKYEFTSFKQREKTGNWWKRERVGYYLPPISKQDLNTQ